MLLIRKNNEKKYFNNTININIINQPYTLKNIQIKVFYSSTTAVPNLVYAHPWRYIVGLLGLREAVMAEIIKYALTKNT